MTCVILYAEDEENDVFFFEIALKIAGLQCSLKTVSDGAQAIEYLAGKGAFADRATHPLPGIVILDISMPKRSGLEVLEWVRQQPQFESLPVLMLTSSTRPEDKNKARQLGANDYLLKPSDPFKLADLVRSIADRWLSGADRPGGATPRQSSEPVAQDRSQPPACPTAQ